MGTPIKIDRSFKERQGVLHLLDKLKKENITYAEMDEIGSLIQKAGRSAVQPLLRGIATETSGLLVSKYTYLLDFLDDSYWLDQIIRIALKRRDLEFEGKSALLATLEDCGIDTTAPPFSTLLSSVALPARELFAKLSERGEHGIASLLEEFTSLHIEMKKSFLLDLSTWGDERVIDYLEMLLWHDDEPSIREVIAALGRFRSPRAADVLHRFRQVADALFHQEIDKSLRRLSFTGIFPEKKPRQVLFKELHSACASPVDGNGFRNILIARWRTDGNLASIDLQIHDVNGLEDAWGEMVEDPGKFSARVSERISQELIEPVAPEYAMELLCDALQRSRTEGYPLPPEFMLRRTLFTPEELRPCTYTPTFPRRLLQDSPQLLHNSAQLFEDEFFAGWAIESSSVYDIAEDWIELEKGAKKPQPKQIEKLIEELCLEEFQPKLDILASRLLLNADYMARTGAPEELVTLALVTAESIRCFTLPCHLHPFMRRFAMESMIVAREALEEGYDIREYED